MAWVRPQDQPIEGSGWTTQNSVAFGGLGTARKLIQTLTEQLRDEELDDDSIVAISLEIDYLLIALTGLAEAAGPKTLDAEYESLCTEPGKAGTETEDEE